MLESWIRKDDFDPKTRPWYKKALEAAENEIVASEPYLFYPSKKPGITISTRWRKRDTGRHFITAIDIMLSNITRFTQAMRPTENGVVFVFTQDLRLVGLPADKRFSDENAVNAALLKTISEVNFPSCRQAWPNGNRKGVPASPSLSSLTDRAGGPASSGMKITLNHAAFGPAYWCPNLTFSVRCPCNETFLWQPLSGLVFCWP